jgi:hypothetical protein
MTKLADGIHIVSTSGHGGVKLSAGRNDQIPDQHEQWAMVAGVFLNAFGPEDVSMADKTLRDWQPDA